MRPLRSSVEKLGRKSHRRRVGFRTHLASWGEDGELRVAIERVDQANCFAGSYELVENSRRKDMTNSACYRRDKYRSFQPLSPSIRGIAEPNLGNGPVLFSRKTRSYSVFNVPNQIQVVFDQIRPENPSYLRPKMPL